MSKVRPSLVAVFFLMMTPLSITIAAETATPAAKVTIESNFNRSWHRG